MVGVDIVKIDRISSIAKKHSIHKIFTGKELDYANSKVGKFNPELMEYRKHETLAGMFAAKEAFLKAIGIGIGSNITLFDIQILHNDTGKPYIEESEKIQMLMKTFELRQLDLSISHDGDYAIAVVQLL